MFFFTVLTCDLCSLMESFVPFGGFFPLACESKYTMNSTCQPMFLRCQLCNDMYEQDVAAIAKGWSNTSKEDQRQEILPSWLRNTETDTSNKGLDFTKVCVFSTVIVDS